MKKRVIWGASIAVAALCLCFGSMEGCHPYIDPSENGIDERICTDEGGAVRETAGETEDKISGEIPDKTAGEDVDDTTGGADGETVDIDFTIREAPVDTARYDAQTDRVYKAPDNTWGISPCAFLGADHLREVYLPSRLKEIKEYTFSDCKNLRKVVVKNKKKISNVEENAFDNCPNLKEHVKDKDW